MRLIGGAAVILFLGFCFSVHAAEIAVLSAGAIEPGLKAAAAAFEKQNGHKVRITFNTAPQIIKRIAAGDVFDVIIAPPSLIADFTRAGKIEGGGVDVGRVGSGVAVRPGAPVPAIGTADDIRRAVLDADSIVFNRASTGIYFENLLKKMGVWERVEQKTIRYDTGAEVMKRALKGKGREVAFGPITEILLEKGQGLVFVGPLPTEIQNYTSYVAAPVKASAQKTIAEAFVGFLGGSAAKPLFVAAGIE